MNQGFRQNSFGQCANSNQNIPYNGMFQPRHAPWNQAVNFNSGHFNRFSSPPQYHPRGSGGPGSNSRPQFMQFENFQPRHNFHQKPYVTNFRNKQFQRGKRNNQKKKIDKRELPENNRFYCDTCDRGFGSNEKFEEHVSLHEKCSDPACSYVAAPKLVKLHFQMQHRTGLARKIWQIESPEDIKRWIEERKRNFPTAAQIEKKKALQAERIARGEKLETKVFGKMRGSHNKHGRHGNRKRHIDGYQSPSNDHLPAAKKICTESDTSSSVVSGTDDPLSAILQKPQSQSKRNENKQLPSGVVNVAGGLASLMASYTADSDTEESPNTSPVKHKKSPTPSPSKSPKGKKDNVPKEDACLTKKQRGNPKKRSDIFTSKQPTLLERLLANEIRHERNVLLQCVHYIVKKNFFSVEMNGKRSSVGS